MVDGTTTGGAGGPTVTVTNGTDFVTQAASAGPKIIQVQGVLSIGSAKVSANKTIIGLGTNATLYGKLDISDSVGASNVIVRFLRVTGPIDDAIAIWNAPHVWIDHCTLYDSADGLCDMNHGTQPLYATISWCKFHYVNQPQHRFTMIADGTYNSTTGVTNFGYYTLHHNWWSTNCNQRQAASSYGRVHYYNNYFNATNNGYCSNARCGTEFLSENNCYSGVKDPIYKECTGLIKTSGNLYSGTIGKPPDAGTDLVFTPPYSYTLDATASVITNIIANAGAPGPDIIAIPPKIWDGGGSDGNWNTANNWGFNETPKQADTLLFAGSTRLTAANNYAANFEFFGLGFSNNAGAFVLNGANLKLGRTITDDSTAVQTLNNHIDFSFGQDRQDPNRYINVTAPTGSLVLNGNLAGNSNAYFNYYNVTKQGPGLVTINGMNTVHSFMFLNGGLVRFSTLDTNLAGSLGACSNFTFNGGGLQWATGNTSDISVSNVVTINTNGAMLDVVANNVTFINRIGNNGAGGLTKVGTGRLIFNATNNYKGNTLIGQGVLALGATGLLTNSPQIILSNNAVLDVSARADATQTLLSGRTLIGNGTVRGSVIAASGATISPGFSIGALIITNALTFQAGSTNVMELNAGVLTNDVLTGMTSVTYGGRLVVTNLAGTFAAGQSFKLFQAANYLGGFSSLSLPVLPANLSWTNRLALDGTIAVVANVNTSPTNLGFFIGSNALQLNWPADHVGWRLEAQTNNNTEGLSSNWFNVSGSASTNAVVLPLDRAAGNVFFRLVYP